MPLPVKVPVPLMTSAAAGVNTDPESVKVNVPLTAKLPVPVTEAPLAMVRLLKVRVPELDTDELLFMVMVPAVGARVLVAFTVNMPLTLKLVAG